MAGWPFRYLTRYPPSVSPSSGVSLFSSRALAANIGLLFVGTVILLLCQGQRQRRVGSSQLRISIVDLLAMTMVAAIPLGWWQYNRIERRTHQRFADELRSAGAIVHECAWLPRAFAAMVPVSVQQDLRRVRQVRLEQPSAGHVERLVAYPYLTLLRIGGGDYPLAGLDQLPANPHLVDVRISDRALDSGAMRAIGSIQRLQTLNLMRTSVTGTSLAALDRLNQLRRLSVTHSPAVLDQTTPPEWSEHVETLWVGHHLPGDQATLKIHRWSSLQRLVVQEFETPLDESPFSIELVDLPKLQSISLDQSRKFDLAIRRTPRLKDIEADNQHSQRQQSRGLRLPQSIWLGKLAVDGAASLKRIRMYVVDLTRLRLRGTPNLAEVIAVNSTWGYDGGTRAERLKRSVARTLIEGFGAGDGPASVDLTGLPIASADLSPLAGNRRLVTLKLSDSGIHGDQLTALAEMKWLRHLEFAECPLGNDRVQWILDSFPLLEHLSFSPRLLIDGRGATGLNPRSSRPFEQTTLRILDRPHLQTIDTGDEDLSAFDHIEVINAPNLRTKLHLGAPRQLNIEHAPQVSELVVHYRYPAASRLSGLAGLTKFASGGPGITDDVLTMLAGCGKLKAITLAYPAVTADGLRSLTNLTNLTALHVPGTPLSDEIVAGWPTLTSMSNLDVSDTDVTVAAVKRLIAGPVVVRLVLDRINAKPQQLSFLADKETLMELSLAAVGITAGTLEAILDRGDLIMLDLSDCELDSAVFDVLQRKGHSLRYLALRNCVVPTATIRDIAARYPSLKFDLAGSSVSTDLITGLLARRQLADREHWWIERAMRSNRHGYRGVDFWQTALPAAVDVQLFEQLAGQSRR